MKLKLLPVIFALILLPLVAFSAEVSPGALSGKLLDRATLAPVGDANIVVKGTDHGIASDAAGQFVIPSVKHGSYTVEASKLGYQSVSLTDVIINPGRTTEVEFLLEPANLLGEEVVVKTGYFRKSPDLPTSVRSLNMEEIRRAPGSVEDVQRVIQALPGVVNANDQTNEIVVRGGSPTENLTLIDGIEIDNINHFPNQATSGGPISAVNLKFLKDITFSTGGYSARYGDKSSSLLALELRDGSRDRWLAEAEMSMAGAGFQGEGPFGAGKGTFLGSIRRSYLSLMQGAIGLTAVPNYYDGQFRASWDFSPVVKGSLFGMYSNDWILIESDEPDAWSRGAETVDAKYDRLVLGGRIRWVADEGFADLVIGRVTTNFDEDVIEMPEKQPIYRNHSTETLDQISVSWNGRSREGREWSAGIGVKPVTFRYNNWGNPDTFTYDLDGDRYIDTMIVTPAWGTNSSRTSLKTSAFAQYSYRPLSNLTTIAGVRYDGFELSGAHKAAPRFSLRWDLNDLTSVSLATGIYYQAQPLFYYLFDPYGGNEKLPFIRSDHYVASFSRTIGEGRQASVELFYKNYSKLPIWEPYLHERAGDEAFRSWVYLPVGKKWARGIELFVQQKMVSNWYGTFSYSYGESRTTDPSASYPSDYDFRHVGTVVLGREFSLIKHKWFNDFQRSWYGWWSWALPLNGDEVTLSSRFRYVSGRPYTSRIFTRRFQDEGHRSWTSWERSDELNDARYPDYARFDVRWDSKWYAGRRSITVFLEVENVLNRPNVAEYMYDNDNPEITTAYQFPFFFVGGFRVGF